MTEHRAIAERDAALAEARRWQMLAEARAADCDNLRAICASYERDLAARNTDNSATRLDTAPPVVAKQDTKGVGQ